MSGRRIVLVDYDPAWAAAFDREAAALRDVLGDRAFSVEHVGSTSVPGLVAKPVVDILLVVADSSDEPSYAPRLEAAGYVLRVREPEMYQHRMFNGPRTPINVHVFSARCPEIERMLAFRDWLRHNARDRETYANLKRNLAREEWDSIDGYAKAKSAVVTDILARAEAPIDVTLVQELLREQHEDLSGLPLEESFSGWDNTVFRLGQQLAVRLPRRATSATLVQSEQRWLPHLSPQLPLKFLRRSASEPRTPISMAVVDRAVVCWRHGARRAGFRCEFSCGRARRVSPGSASPGTPGRSPQSMARRRSRRANRTPASGRRTTRERGRS